MIKEWSVTNFKSIKDKVSLKLRPLTILAGTNSSGKSTFIQSMLLVSQTLSHKIDNRALVLNGALTDLGQFDDLRCSDGTSQVISIGFRCEPKSDQGGSKLKKLAMTSRGPIYYGPRNTGFESINCELSFDSPTDVRSSTAGHYLSASQLRLLSSHLTCTPRSDSGHKSEMTINCRLGNEIPVEVDIGTQRDERLNEGLNYEVSLDEHSNIEIKSEYMSAHPKGCLLRHFLPRRVIYEINQTLETANAVVQCLQNGLGQVRNERHNILPDPVLTADILDILQKVLKNEVKIEELFAARARATLAGSGNQAMELSMREWYEGLLTLAPEERIKVQQVLREDDDLFARIYDSLKKRHPNNAAVYVQDRPPEQITVAAWYLDDFFSTSLRYLAPLRDNPKALYPKANMLDSNDIGVRGENTASIINIHKDRLIQYMPSAAFAHEVIERKIVQATLAEAVVDWMSYLGLATDVDSVDLGKIGHSLQVGLDSSSHKHDLTHVGVGVSQVLPVLVLSLLSDSDVTLVIEQPELHLHPKIQTLLGDFFLSLAMSDKQCLIETHSEYIVDRIRYRIAADTCAPSIADLTGLYFAEKSDNGSTFREIEINDYGAIVDWPEGFFDQSCQQATDILRAAHKKRLDAAAGTQAQG